MSENSDLHRRLIDRQSDEELERKAKKAGPRGIWAQETLDWARRRAKRLSDWIAEWPEEPK